MARSAPARTGIITFMSDLNDRVIAEFRGNSGVVRESMGGHFTAESALGILSLIVRFDDHAHGPDGAQLYRNRTLLLDSCGAVSESISPRAICSGGGARSPAVPRRRSERLRRSDRRDPHTRPASPAMDRSHRRWRCDRHRGSGDDQSIS